MKLGMNEAIVNEACMNDVHVNDFRNYHCLSTSSPIDDKTNATVVKTLGKKRYSEPHSILNILQYMTSSNPDSHHKSTN